jgi:hypothetical protein
MSFEGGGGGGGDDDEEEEFDVAHQVLLFSEVKRGQGEGMWENITGFG